MTPEQPDPMRLYAERLVATWPPLSAAQRDRLYVLLAPMRTALRKSPPSRRVA